MPKPKAFGLAGTRLSSRKRPVQGTRTTWESLQQPATGRQQHLRATLPGAQRLFSAEGCRNRRILNSNTKLLKRTEVVTLHSNITVLYVGKKKEFA